MIKKMTGKLNADKMKNVTGKEKITAASEPKDDDLVLYVVPGVPCVPYDPCKTWCKNMCGTLKGSTSNIEDGQDVYR